MAKGLLLGAGFSFDLGMPLASEFSDTLFSFFNAEKMCRIINNMRGHRPYSNDRTLCAGTAILKTWKKVPAPKVLPTSK